MDNSIVVTQKQFRKTAKFHMLPGSAMSAPSTIVRRAARKLHAYSGGLEEGPSELALYIAISPAPGLALFRVRPWSSERYFAMPPTDLMQTSLYQKPATLCVPVPTLERTLAVACLETRVNPITPALALTYLLRPRGSFPPSFAQPIHSSPPAVCAYACSLMLTA